MIAFGKLSRRSDFTAARKGRRFRTPAFTAQIAKRSGEAEAGGPRVGLTVTKKVGGAVERNRIKRRLRAAVREADAVASDAASDHVLIATREALTIPFDRLARDVAAALAVQTARTRKKPDLAHSPSAGA